MMRRAALFASVAVGLGLGGCGEQAPPAPSVTSSALSSDAASVLHGALLFDRERFDGNDRVCSTCHVFGDGLQLSTAHVRAAFARDPDDPLFRALDSDARDGASYALMRDDALVRVHVTLPPNVSVDEVDGRDVRVRPDGRYEVTLRRATPTVLNAALQEHLMWDGRNGTDLAAQAAGAVADHAEGRAPTTTEAGDIAAFQRQLFSRPSLALYANGGAAPTLPEGITESQRRGRNFFVSAPLSGSRNQRGLCATCHSGPMLNRTNEFNPGDPPGLAFAGNRTSEFNVRGLPSHTYRIALPRDLVVPPGVPLPIPPGTVIAPAGTVLTVQTPDPGALVVDLDPTDGLDAANPCLSPIPCILGAASGTTVVFHRIPTLWGIGRTAPYFHDNSAATLEEAVVHYRAFFAPTEASLRATAAQAEALGDLVTAAALRDIADALPISDQDVVDIAAYLRLL